MTRYELAWKSAWVPNGSGPKDDLEFVMVWGDRHGVVVMRRVHYATGPRWTVEVGFDVIHAFSVDIMEFVKAANSRWSLEEMEAALVKTGWQNETKEAST